MGYVKLAEDLQFSVKGANCDLLVCFISRRMDVAAFFEGSGEMAPWVKSLALRSLMT